MRLASQLTLVVLGGFALLLAAMVLIVVVATAQSNEGQANILAKNLHAVIRSTQLAQNGVQVSPASEKTGAEVHFELSDDRAAAALSQPDTKIDLRHGEKYYRYVAPLGSDFPGVAVTIEFPLTLLRKNAKSVGASAAMVLGLVMTAIGIGVFLVIRRATRRLGQLTGMIQDAVEHIDLTRRLEVKGGDEIAELAGAFNALMGKLREVIGGLHQASSTLAEAGTNLTTATAEQQHIVTRQAAAIEQSLVTAEEIKQSSIAAAERAQSVLRVADEALKTSESGEESVNQSLSGLADIRNHVATIAEKITQLSTRTQQISGITGTVKDLADSSNMLALNAAIEAVRSGEHGKGFGVVAREIRNLADQSIQATKQVREILEDIGTAIQTVAEITEQGAARIEVGLLEMKSSGETLRSLAQSVKENSAGARQIAAAVSQQNAGIVQIFAALSDQSKLTENTLEQLSRTSRVAGEMSAITAQVSSLVGQYRI